MIGRKWWSSFLLLAQSLIETKVGMPPLLLLLLLCGDGHFKLTYFLGV